MKYKDLPGNLQNDCAMDYGREYIDILDWEIEPINPEIIISPFFSIEKDEAIHKNKKYWIDWFKLWEEYEVFPVTIHFGHAEEEIKVHN